MGVLSTGKVIEVRTGELFLHYLDEALDTYGTSVKQVVYWKFEKTHNISRNEIRSCPEKFVETIRSIFGNGMSIIERAIVRELERLSGISSLESSDLAKALRQLSSALNTKAGEIN